MSHISAAEGRRANANRTRGDVAIGPGAATGRGAARALLAEQAYDALRDRIVTLTIAPGAPIDEDAIGEQLGMGRTPVREAIKRLALENLVTVYPRRGTFASEINITDLAHISDVRVQLESHAAQRAAERITREQRSELAALQDALARGASGEAHEPLMVLDAEVHRFVYRCAANPYLEETLSRYFNLSLRIWHLVLDRLPHVTARVHEHEELLNAIADGAPERARAIMAEHVRTFGDEIRAVL